MRTDALQSAWASGLHFAFVAFFALFPLVNPIGTALMIAPFLRDLDERERRAASRRIAVYGFLLCISVLVVGSSIFRLFGISQAVVQVAGGILICRTGWTMLNDESPGTPSDDEVALAEARSRVATMLFYPLTFPMTTGAGTISVLLALSARIDGAPLGERIANFVGIVVAVLAISGMVYVAYSYTPYVLRKLSREGQVALNRLTAFLVFCVGIQLLAEGVRRLAFEANS